VPRLPAEQADLYEPLARELRKLREEAGLSVRDLQRKTGYSLGTVEDVLSGHRRTSAPAVVAVATALGADAEEWSRRSDAVGLPATTRTRHPRCEVDDCPNDSGGRRFCSTHARHQLLYGNPTAGRFSPKTHAADCSVEGCDRPYSARGFCRSHYEKHLRAKKLSAGIG